MTPLQLIDKIHSTGGTIWSDGADLHLRVPKGMVTPEFKVLLQAEKNKLLDLLPVGLFEESAPNDSASNPHRPQLVHVHDCPAAWRSDPCYLYVGTENEKLGLDRSPYASPSDIDCHQDQNQYRKWLCGQSSLIERALVELPGRHLVCNCDSPSCHGEVLVELLKYLSQPSWHGGQRRLQLGDQEYSYSIWQGERLLGRAVAIDTETTLIDRHDIPDLVLASVSDGEHHYLVEPSRLPQFICVHRAKHFVCHNSTYDFWVIDKYLEQSGDRDALGYWWLAAHQGRLHDTMLLDQLVRLAQRDEFPRNRDLGSLTEEYCGLELAKDDDHRTRFAEVLGHDLASVEPGFLQYAMADAIATYWTYVRLHTKALELQPTRDYVLSDCRDRFGLLSESIQVRASIALAAITRNGMKIDKERVQKLRADIHSEIERLRDELENRAEQIPSNQLINTVSVFRRNNQGEITTTGSGVPHVSQKELAELLKTIATDAGIEVGRTETTKKVTTSAKWWSKYRDCHPLIDTWCRLSEKSKLATFLTALDVDRIHPRYQVLVRTGRTSCASPNIQQLPRAAGFRELIVASPGHYLLAIDYSAIELRTLAAICERQYGKSVLADTLRSGIDPHAYTAAMFNGQSLDDFLQLRDTDTTRFKQLRQRSKALNFGIPGGLGAASLVEYAAATYGVQLSLNEAKSFRRKLINKVYPELRQYLTQTSKEKCAQIERNGWPVVTLTGRVRDPVQFSQSRNTPFQGLAADGAKLALWQLLLHGYRMVAFIHDEVLIELPRETDHTGAAAEINRIMCDTMLELTGTVPIECEYSLSERRSKKAEAVFDEDGRLVPWAPDSETE